MSRRVQMTFLQALSCQRIDTLTDQVAGLCSGCLLGWCCSFCFPMMTVVFRCRLIDGVAISSVESQSPVGHGRRL